ncbi:MAG: hypothetical protein ACXAC7_21780 [Candidatus Hodarchaeales archaeon]|jgi:predicted PurR-regulated permease PerM
MDDNAGTDNSILSSMTDIDIYHVLAILLDFLNNSDSDFKNYFSRNVPRNDRKRFKNILSSINQEIRKFYRKNNKSLKQEDI